MQKWSQLISLKNLLNRVMVKVLIYIKKLKVEIEQSFNYKLAPSVYIFWKIGHSWTKTQTLKNKIKAKRRRKLLGEVKETKRKTFAQDNFLSANPIWLVFPKHNIRPKHTWLLPRKQKPINMIQREMSLFSSSSKLLRCGLLYLLQFHLYSATS